MKQFVKPFAMIAAVIITTLSQPVLAAPAHGPHHSPVTAGSAKEETFSVELLKGLASERIYLTIKNPGKKNLYVSLNAPDGISIDDFYTGKKSDEITKVYNFSVAESGVYTIEVTCGTETIKKQITLEHITLKEVHKLTVE